MGLGRLSSAQRSLVDSWLPGAVVVDDLSWNLLDTTVLRVRHGASTLIVKAAGPEDHHLPRELEAYGWDGPSFTEVWSREGLAPSLLRADPGERIVVLDDLAGDLAYGTTARLDPDVHRRAGRLLRAFHDQSSVPSRGTDAAATVRAFDWLDGVHAIAPDIEQRLREELATLHPVEAPLVPTHGDWHPRNWLVDGDVVRVIDLGRFAFRPAATDFARLAAQEWRTSPECERAFLEGYGDDPREPAHWLLMRLREAIATAAWAHRVGDTGYEEQGHQMIADVLTDIDAARAEGGI